MHKHITISRRRFLQQSALVSAAAFAPLSNLRNNAAESAHRTPGWIDRPMRWAQLTLVEDDPGKYDPQFWLDYFERTHSDAACLSAGGVVAYYPTRIPLHHRSQWMGDTDPFGELVAGCRKQDMVVIARTDSHAVHQDVFEAHPEWIAVDAEGKKRRHWASPEMWVTCALGPYNFEQMTAIHREITQLYKVDGIFINRWNGSGMCYCESCALDFKTATGYDLPRSNNVRDKARREHTLWRQQRLFDLWRLWDAEVRAINPDACVIPNTGGGALSSLDMKGIGQIAETLMADRQARRGLTVPWANGKNGKEYRSTMGNKPIVGIFSVGVEEPYRWKDSVQSDAEIRLWVADGIANGLRPWFTKFGGTLYDRRWLKVVEELYRWHHGAERYLRNEAPIARVGLVYSQQSAWFYGGSRAREKVEDHALGMYHALIEGRIPFEMVHDGLLDPEPLSKFKTLILPNIAALSEGQCNQLRAFVKQGGSLVATHETSLYDEWGTRRTNFGLADLFGASFAGAEEGPMQNSYLELQRDPQTGNYHPVLAGLEDAGRIINGVRRVQTNPSDPKAYSPLTLIPSYPDLPMEKVYPRTKTPGSPQVFLRELGASRIVYFPWDIDRVFWEVLCVDHGKLLRNAIEWATAEEKPVTVTGPGILDVTAWRQKNSMTVHLVNLTNPMMMKGPIRELIPISEQNVRIRLPEGVTAKNVKLLVSGARVSIQTEPGHVSLVVPSILAHEVIAIDF